jgi:hypothetical protein
MLTISEAQRRTELFLTGQMLEALRAVEYELPSFDTQLYDVDLTEVARAQVEIRHVRGASDATYLIPATITKPARARARMCAGAGRGFGGADPSKWLFYFKSRGRPLVVVLPFRGLSSAIFRGFCGVFR